MSQPVTAALVGAGHRGLLYARYGLEHPDEMKLVAVADPRDYSRALAVNEHGLPEGASFASARDLARSGTKADFVINGTMDKDHLPTSLPLLAAGYDLLLEKPIATSAKDTLALLKAARRGRRKVAICHVLRYAPFYAEIRKRVLAGEIGQVLNVQTTEHVSYHHFAAAFNRGKWGNVARGGSTFLMQKCCHDLDLITWMKSGSRPVRVSSFGSRTYFRPERAPQGAGTRCLVDCSIEAGCPYSTKNHYLDKKLWTVYAFDGLMDRHPDPSDAQKEAYLKEKGHRFGECVWKTDGDIVDHQSVLIEFEDGAVATHNLVGGTALPGRTLHLLGTHGEIQGSFESGKFVIRHIDKTPGKEYTEEIVDTAITGDFSGASGAHGGGDMRLVRDFVRICRGETPSISSTSIEDSVYGHLTGFCADESRMKGKVVQIPKL
ncbi:MAG: Gfo/Idh/MocA family oxidoreductase [Spirochaetes bacterium]|nr:Gfo/Idh/MocA family oxidoreductase [Spirochaetota bacterium]